MRELPIRYLAPMVRAVRAGDKTQTRRIVNDQADMEFDPNDPTYGPYWLSYATEAEGKDAKVQCPYGKPGDRLWVQEAWRVSSAHDYLPPSQLPRGLTVEYLADGSGMLDGKTRPSIHMPRWASRITLEVTEVRVQRLNNISEADALAEGIAKLPLTIDPSGTWWSADSTQPRLYGLSPVVAFLRLWRSIYGDDSCVANPRVWAVSFKLIHSQSQHD
jgi:hypothetical protein